MNVNFLRKFFMLVLLVVGCAGGAWADDANSTDVVQLINTNGEIVGTYGEFTTALDNVTEDGMTLKVIKDWTAGKQANGIYDLCIFSKTGKSVILDLNSHTLSFPYATSGIGAQKGSKLTIVDNSKLKTATLNFAAEASFGVGTDSELNIESGTYTLNSTYTYISVLKNGKLNIKYGAFKKKGSGDLIKDDEMEETAEINISGGEFSKEDNSVLRHVTYGNTLLRYEESTTREYPYYIGRYDMELNYGDGTRNVQVRKSDNYTFTIDLKDDGDLSTSLSKISVPYNLDNFNVTVKKNFANTNWHAFYVPFDINVSEDLLQNFEIAKIWDTELNLDDNSTTIEFIKLADGQQISAFTPCLIKAKATGKQDITFPNVTVYKNQTKSIDCSNVDETFTFTGVMENTTLNGRYALDSETGILTAIENANAEVTPLKFYMTVESKPPATSIKSRRFAVRVIGDETTGINDISGDAQAKADTAVYNLQGVKVGTSTTGLPTGIYIQNGRKVVVK